MTVIAGALLRREPTDALIEEWFHIKTGRECPVDVSMFRREAYRVGVNFLGLYCMAIIETGYFTSEIFKTKKNMFGLGAVDSDPVGGAATFGSYLEAVRAGAEHLAVYGGSRSVKDWAVSQFVLERTGQVKKWGYFGVVTEFGEMGGKDAKGRVLWASNPQHGAQIERMYGEILGYCIGRYNDAPRTPDEPPRKTPEPNPAPPIKEEPAPVPDENKKPEPEPGPVVPIHKDSIWTVIMHALKTLQPFVAKINPWFGWILLFLYSLLDIFF
jgi:hypothetical protein